MEIRSASPIQNNYACFHGELGVGHGDHYHNWSRSEIETKNFRCKDV